MLWAAAPGHPVLRQASKWACVLAAGCVLWLLPRAIRRSSAVRRIDNPSRTAWVQRLIDQRVEYVVSLAPDNTLESKWMAALPELFEPVAASADGLNRAYRFRRSEAVRVAQGRCAIPLRRK